jgi:5'-3' exonuclease
MCHPDPVTSPTPSRPDRLMLLDSASLYFRAFFGVPVDVTAPDGSPVNAVRGFLDMIATLVAAHRPTRLVACWDDDWRPAWRVGLLPSYKTHRLATGSPDPVSAQTSPAEEVPDALSPQVPVIEAVLAAIGIARVGAAGCEADDVIGTLATRACTGTAVDIVTGDRDLFQLIDDERAVRVLYVARGVRNRVAVDQTELAARYGVVDGDAYADLAVLRGDASDGIPGVAGIGEKTAAALLARHGTLTGVLSRLNELTVAQRRRLTDAAGYLAVAPRVVRVLRDADLPMVDDRLPSAPSDPAGLDALCRRWGLRTSVDRVLAALVA